MTKTIDGLPVIDAKRPLTLHITGRDISLANPKQPHACAAARACLRELGAKEARIHLGRIYIRTNNGNWQRYQTPGALRDEIIAFDRGGRFEPITVELHPVYPGHALGTPRRGGVATGKGKRRRPYHLVKNVRDRA
jgi:hypothetical protein